MPDYAKTIIYKLINYDYPDLVYVGSTTNFTKRKQYHKQASINNTNNKNNNVKIYETIRKFGGWESWNMVKICDFPCKTQREAEQEEDKHMLELKSNLNMIRAFRPSKQYYVEKKEKIKETYEKNKEVILRHHKEYYEKNKEDILKQHKLYKEKNRENIIKSFKVKTICECGCEVVRYSLKRHKQTSKHIDLMKYL
jgi:hypothetical protein